MPHEKSSSEPKEKKPKAQPHGKTENSHSHPPSKEEEKSLDRTLEESFPASDPLSSIPDPDADAA